MHAALIALVVAATPYAPLGLHWGMSAKEVAAVIEPRFTYVRVDSTPAGAVALYRGEFAGLPTDAVGFFFTAAGLQGVWARFEERDQVPASRRYQQLVSKMKEAHGAPTQATAMPAHLRGEYDLLDRALQKGEWEAMSEWVLEGAGVLVSVSVGHADKNGVVPLVASIAIASDKVRADGAKEGPPGKGDL